MLNGLVDGCHLRGIFVHEELVIHDGGLEFSLMQLQVRFQLGNLTICSSDLLEYFPPKVFMYTSTFTKLVIEDGQLFLEAKALVYSCFKHVLRL